MTKIPDLLDFVMRISVKGGSLSSTQNGPPPLTGQGGRTPQSSSSLKSSVLNGVQKILRKVATFLATPLKYMSHGS